MKIDDSNRQQGNANIRKALEDILARSPDEVRIEVPGSAAATVVDEDQPWSGNIYKYSF